MAGNQDMEMHADEPVVAENQELVVYENEPPVAENQQMVIQDNNPPIAEMQQMVTHEDEPPQRKRRGNRSSVDWATFNSPAVLAKPGWEEEPEPWTRTVCARYVDWAHINRHWAPERNETQVRSGVALIPYCQHPAFKKRLTEVALALWGELSKRDGTFSLCSMAYVEVFLGKDVNWNTFLSKPRGGQMPNKSRNIPQNPAVPLEGEDVALAQAGGVADPMEVDLPLQGANVLNNLMAPEFAPHEHGRIQSSGPMPPRTQGIPVAPSIRGVLGAQMEVAALCALVEKMRFDSAEALRKHEMEVEAYNVRVKTLEEENARLLATNNELLARGSRLSTEDIAFVDDVVEQATYGLIEPNPPVEQANTFQVRPRGTLPTPHFRGESSNAAIQSTNEGGQELISVARVLHEGAVARAERAEVERDEAKASLEAISASKHEVEGELALSKAVNQALLLHNPEREQMLYSMSNMRLACTLATNEIAQMQREVARIGAQFGDGGHRYFGLTSWARLEEMFPDTLPVNRGNASIDWNGHPHLDFQFNTATYRYAEQGVNGPHPLLWPNVPEFVKDGTTCIICQEPFGPEGGWTLGTCGHVYHPGCLIPHMVTRKRCAQCKAPFHKRLYQVFGLEFHMPENFEFTEENLPGEESRAYWGRDMIWMWKWGHDTRHLGVNSVQDIPWQNDAEITEVCKRVILASDPGRRVFFGQLAGGHWDLERQQFVRQPHPRNMLFDSTGNPLGVADEMDHAAQMNYVEDTTFNEPLILSSIYSHLHDRYDDVVVAALESLQSREGLQTFLRNSIARGILEPEEG